MSFVPVASTPPPSPRAVELGRQLRETIDSFCQDHPGASASDIRQALDLARAGGETSRLALGAALLVGTLLLGVLSFFYFARATPDESQMVVMPMIIGISIVAVGVAFALRKR